MHTIRDWPASERPRERLLTHGPAALSDAELLAIILRSGVNGKTAVDLARELLQAFGGLRPLLEADRRRFCDMHGLGTATYVQVQALLEMARRHLQAQLQREDVLENPDMTRHYLVSRLRHYRHEVFACLFLDNRHRVIAFEELFRGTIDGGVAEPSRADIQLTRRLVDALGLMDIRVLDHLVIGDGAGTSLAERGLL
jgi:DNA repair protein RadC